MTYKYFHRGEQEAQRRWETSDVWNESRKQELLWNAIPADIHDRLSKVPFFFLATSDDKGNYDCSFKGGGISLITVINPKS